MTDTIPIPCPVNDCSFIGRTKREWIQHYKKKHPDIQTLRLGTEVIDLEKEDA